MMSPCWWRDPWPHVYLVPPFPGARSFALTPTGERCTGSVQGLSSALRRARVGGVFWGRRVDLPVRTLTRRIVDRNAIAVDAAIARGAAGAAVWRPDSTQGALPPGDLDVWHLFDQVDAVCGSADDAFILLAAAAGKRVQAIGQGRFADIADWAPGRIDEALAFATLCDPFSQAPASPFQLVDQLEQWRLLLDGNRTIAGAVGFAAWKRPTTSALLWDGNAPVRYVRDPAKLPLNSRIATWSAKVTSVYDDAITARSMQRVEVEDGFIRSVGLGVDCVPPLSLCVDPDGLHFDPARASGLERLLAEAQFDTRELARASALRQRLVAGAITKYAAIAAVRPIRPAFDRVVLVVGQVEDDRSVRMGGAGITSNLALLQRVRALEPVAFIVYRPHPDVETGLRAGAVDDDDVLALANEVCRDVPILALIEMVDAVHVLTSLAGFEALLRDRAVITHGVPFYAGWGLTHDLGPIPERRGRKRSLDELVAAALIRYPRYLDPVTGWPCPVEVLVDRIEDGAVSDNQGLLPALRRAQGFVLRRLGQMRRAALGA